MANLSTPCNFVNFVNQLKKLNTKLSLGNAYSCLFAHICERHSDSCTVLIELCHWVAFSNAGMSDGLVLASGYQTTHILPMVQGRLDSKHCKRLNVGGAHAVAFMHKLLQLKYPAHFAAINLSRAEVIVHRINLLF